ncbi:hypothetical protein GQ457_15G029020 [Hibiscus cannabinus]
MFSTVSGSTGNEDIVDLLDMIKVVDLNGNEIPIFDLWKDRKVVAFARHFGCVFCRKRADYLASKKVNYCKLINSNLKTQPTLEF